MTKIIVKDRRKPRHYRIDNVVFDEWLPLLGTIGYTLYSTYTRMADSSDERSWPGYQLIENHLNISPGSIADYNRLLAWCGLVHIEPGNPVTNTPNNYYILEPEPVSIELLHQIRRQATEHYAPSHTFLIRLIERLENWRPLSSYYRNTATGPEIIKATHVAKHPTHPEKHPASLHEYPTSLHEYPTSLHEQATSLHEHPTSLHAVDQQPPQKTKQTKTNKNQEQPTNNNMPGWLGVTDIFEKLGINEPARSNLAKTKTWEQAVTTAWWCITADWSDNQAGLAVKRFMKGDMPPEGYWELVEFILAREYDMVDVRRELALGEHGDLGMFGLSNGAARAAAAIYRADVSWLDLEIEGD
jgi:hypothetical protein